MMEKLRPLFGEDRAVSPVIGVILMVAITVILAAVIGTFVIGIGDDVEAAPQAQLSIENAGDNESVTISHNGGDSIDGDTLRVTADGNNTDTDVFSDEFTVGDSVDVNVTEADGISDGDTVEVTVIHDPSDSILRSGTVELSE